MTHPDDKIKEVLESLPVITKPNQCPKCGATEWGAWNIDDQGNMTDCDQCRKRMQ